MNSVPEEAVALELVCPAGNPAALEAAVVAGDDVVYAGFADETNARNFPGRGCGRKCMRRGRGSLFEALGSLRTRYNNCAKYSLVCCNASSKPGTRTFIALSGCASDSIPRAKVSNLVAAKLPATPVVVIQAAVDAA